LLAQCCYQLHFWYKGLWPLSERPSLANPSWNPHLQNIDAIAFYAVVLIAVPTNAIKLREWMKHGDGNSNAFETADFYSKLSVYAYIVFLIFDVFS
jgi:hypothetical protein